MFPVHYTCGIRKLVPALQGQQLSLLHFLLGLIFGFVIGELIQSTMVMSAGLGFLFGALMFHSRSVTDAFTSLMGGSVLMSLLVLALDSLPVVPHVPLWAVFLLHVLGIVMVGRFLKSRNIGSQDSASVVLVDSLLVIFGVALLARWPFESPLSYLSLLSYEDNAGWIATASSFSRNHVGAYSDGAGGFVLDPLMASLHFVMGVGQDSSAASFAYQLVGSSYLIVELLAVIAMGLLTLRFSRKVYPAVGPLASLMLALGSSSLAYIACQLPRTTGHLTFIGGMAFIWSLGCIRDVDVTADKSVSGAWLVMPSVLLIGAVGMWWPLALVALLVGATHIRALTPLLATMKLQVASRSKVILIAAISVGALALVAAPASTGFRSMSVREFFAVKGGVQPLPGNSVSVALLVLVVLWVCLDQFDTNRKNNSSISILVEIVVMTGVLTASLYVASHFVGPDFAQNYTTQKTFLLFVLLLIPLAGIGIMALSNATHVKLSAAVTLPLIFLVGVQTVGWNLNDPRGTAIPSWGQVLLDTADANPNALIFCTTSDPTRNMDAYLCSRHASALQLTDYETSTSWRHLQVFPQVVTDSDQARLKALRDALTAKLSRGEKVILISLENVFAVADEDSAWMNQLPLSQMTIVPS